MSNVVKHSGAEHARVKVEENDSTVKVTVEDDGSGLPAERNGQGFGLIGMRERAGLLGGELAVESAPEGGTRVSATLPVLRIDPQGPPG